jgi:hypothetical protein
MPRLVRLDAPGVLHHIIIRGIERRKIFRDDKDKNKTLIHNQPGMNLGSSRQPWGG